MSWFKSNKPDPGEAERLLNEALTIYRSAQQGQSPHRIAEGLTQAQKAADIYHALQSNREITCYNVAGALYRLQQNRPAAIQCEEKGLRLVRQFAPSSESEVQSLNNLASLHREAYSPECMADETSIQHFVQSLRYAVGACVMCRQKFPSSQYYVLAIYHLGHICAEFGDTASATKLLNRCIQLATDQSGLIPNCRSSLRTLEGSAAIAQHDKHRQLAEYILAKRGDWTEVQQLLKDTNAVAG